MNICVYGAASREIAKYFTETGEELGRQMVKRGHSLVFGGGKNGMMGAVARGVAEEGGKLIGIAPNFFKKANIEVSFLDCTEFVYTDTMRERKRLLDEKSDAFIVSPGGIGTFDEFFEILTLKQLGRHNKAIVLLNIDGYFDNMIKMLEVSIEKRFITTDCVELYKVANSIKETLDYLESYDPSDVDIDKVKIR
jgi:uncharacterized protein (TIGR00730 family)